MHNMYMYNMYMYNMYIYIYIYVLILMFFFIRACVCMPPPTACPSRQGPCVTEVKDLPSERLRGLVIPERRSLGFRVQGSWFGFRQQLSANESCEAP